MSKKTTGAVFTPNFIINLILNRINYNDTQILHKTILEPSFGNGEFLLEIVSRFISVARKNSETNIEKMLDTQIYGFEINPIYFEETRRRLNALLIREGLQEIHWSHLYQTDTTVFYQNFPTFFDYIVGNPPYVRIHNLSEDLRENLRNLRFTNGNTDLYVAFYEIGIFMLKDCGILSFISPNSFLKNTSQTSFRKFLLQDSLVKEIIDFGSSKVFPDADTYTCICTLMKGKNTEINYRRHDREVCLWERTFDETYMRKNGLFFLDNDTEKFWKENTEKIQKVKDVWNVQNGVATNLDQVYIGEVFLDKEERKRYFGKNTEERQMVWFHGHLIESDILHRCVKESRYDGGKITEYIFYPYENGKLITEEKMKEKFPNAYEYLRENRERLERRNMENGTAWYAFGRSQGIRYMEQPKVIFQHIVKNQITPYLLEEDVVVYSGLFSIGENLEKLMENYSGKEFWKYCRMMGKPMRGDYVSVSSKMVKNFGID